MWGFLLLEYVCYSMYVELFVLSILLLTNTQIIASDSEGNSAVLRGIEYVSKLISVYAGIENDCLHRDKIQTKDNFTKNVRNLYFHILEFLIKAVCHFSLNTSDRLVRNVLVVDKWQCLLQRIERANDICGQSIAFSLAKDQMTILQLVQWQEERLQILTRVIENKAIEHEKIVNWISDIDVASDHAQARQKLGANYAMSGQWLRPRYQEWLGHSDQPAFWKCGARE